MNTPSLAPRRTATTPLGDSVVANRSDMELECVFALRQLRAQPTSTKIEAPSPQKRTALDKDRSEPRPRKQARLVSRRRLPLHSKKQASKPMARVETEQYSSSTSNDNDDSSTSAKQPIFKGLSWEERLAQLRAYKQEYGNLDFPVRYQGQNRLGRFVSRLRQRYAGTLQPPLSEQEIAQLDQLGMVWYKEVSRVIPWEERMDELRRFRREHGHVRVPLTYTAQGRLGQFCGCVRQQYHGTKKPALREDQIAQLDALGFCWTLGKGAPLRPSSAVSWESRLEALQHFRQVHGHLHVPQGYKEQHRLGSFCASLRQQYHGTKQPPLSRQEVDQLNALGMVWTPKRGNVKK